MLGEGQIFHKHWAIYMSYLYETIFDLGYKIANIPHLDYVHKHEHACSDLDLRNRDNLGYWVKYFGLIVWSRDSLNVLRSEFFSRHYGKYSFFLVVLEAHAMNKELYIARGRPFKWEVEFMTNFLLDIANIYSVNMQMNASNKLELRAFNKAMPIVERYRFINFEMNHSKSFWQLSDLIIEIGYYINKTFLIFKYLAESPVDGRYINQTIDIFRRNYPALFNINYIVLLRKIIIRKSEAHYFASNMQKARAEIKKLAQQPLFQRDTLQLVMNSTEREFAIQMVTMLCRIRNDWCYGSVILQMIRISSSLYSI